MTDAFNAAIRFVLLAEGGESNDPDDPGGLTRYGISQRAHPDVDVAHLTEHAAIDLYRARYWDLQPLDQLPPRLAVALFDGAVQHGIRSAVRMLQDTLKVHVDGVIGPRTLAAASRNGSLDTLIGYCARRACYYGYCPQHEKYALGWNQRLFRLLLYCQSL